MGNAVVVKSAALIVIIAVWQTLWYNIFMVPPTPELRAALKQGYPNTWYDLKDVLDLVELLKRTAREHGNFIVISFSLAYLARHAIPISGEFYMNVIAGALYGKMLGLVLVTALTVVGSALSYAFACYFFGSLTERQRRALRETTSMIHDNIATGFRHSIVGSEYNQYSPQFQWHGQQLFQQGGPYPNQQQSFYQQFTPNAPLPPNNAGALLQPGQSFPQQPVPPNQPPLGQQQGQAPPAGLAPTNQPIQQTGWLPMPPNQPSPPGPLPQEATPTKAPTADEPPIQGTEGNIPFQLSRVRSTSLSQELSCAGNTCINHMFNSYVLLLEVLIFIRLVPFVPSMVLNMGLAIIGVGFREFIISCAFGSIPYNIYGLIVGSRLMVLRTVDDVFHAVNFGTAWAVLIGVLTSLFFKWMGSGYSGPLIDERELPRDYDRIEKFEMPLEKPPEKPPERPPEKQPEREIDKKSENSLSLNQPVKASIDGS